MKKSVKTILIAALLLIGIVSVTFIATATDYPFDNLFEKGFAGYEIPKKDSDETVSIAVYSNDSHICVSKKLYEELLEYKAMYENLCK